MTDAIDRRTALRGGAVVLAGLLAGCAGGGGSGGGGTATPTGTPTPTPTAAETTTGTSGSDGDGGDGGSNGGSVDDWMGDVGNYDGTVVDRTGESEVTVAVGAQGNGGAFAYDPPAVRIDAGTTVTWEWTGEGGQHNVVAEDGADFESELTAEAGHTFSWTPEASGTVTYYCTPHRALGMKGAVVVE